MLKVGLTKEEVTLVEQFGYDEHKFIITCVEQGLKRLRKEKLSGTGSSAEVKPDVKVQEASLAPQKVEEVKTEVDKNGK